MKIKVSTDSTADIPERHIEELGIPVMALTLIIDGKEYRDNVDMHPLEFYDILEKSKELPSHSQPTVAEVEEFFRSALDDDTETLIHVCINAKGSGTYVSAVTAAENLMNSPEYRGKLSIRVIDSTTYSMGYGIPVILGARMARDGAEPDAIEDFIRDWTVNSRPTFVPLDLRCVKKSGRVSAAAAFLGDAVGLKPIITFEDGDAKIIGKARGENKAIQTLMDILKNDRKPGTPYAIILGDNPEASEKFKKLWDGALDQPPFEIYQIGCIISVNAGANMVGVIYRK